MTVQWYLCEIIASPTNEENRLKKTDNLAVSYPDIFFSRINGLVNEDIVEANKSGEGGWYVWLPIIPRVGDTLQFASWQVEVSKVVLETDWRTQDGIKKGLFVSASITLRDDVVQRLTDAYFSIDGKTSSGTGIKWENYARRGHDLQYYAWELRHPLYVVMRDGKPESNYRWHTRIRPVAGDIISVQDKRWKVTSVELASADASVDGWLTLESVQ